MRGNMCGVRGEGTIASFRPLPDACLLPPPPIMIIGATLLGLALNTYLSRCGGGSSHRAT
jgi:hypothetical protein